MRRDYGVGGLLDRLVGLFGRGNVCVELQRHLLRDEEAANVSLDSLARAFGVPVIATNDVRFAESSIARSSTCSPAFATRRRLMARDGSWRATPNSI